MIKKFKKFNIDFLIEGIDINKKNKTIQINLSHEKGLNTSISNNPTYYDIDGIKIISIFQRKKEENFDGNPLLYALKGLNGWKIENFDIETLLKQFIRISEKIDHDYDTLIQVPSSNELNNIFMKRLNKILHAKNKLTDIGIYKKDIEEVFYDCVDWKNMNEVEEKEMENSFKKMGENFTFKFIPTYLRKYIKNYYNNDLDDDISDLINNKNIAILDDTVSSGKTISLFTENIKEIYTPKSMTVITLFSKLI